MTVLILAPEDDDHAVAVEAEISRLGGTALVVDLALFPQESTLEARYSCCGDRDFALSLRGRRYDLSTVGAAWWRRPGHPVVSPDITRESHRVFTVNECSEALAGLWHALDVFWINDPARDGVAHRKVTQLRVAQDVGLRIPQTLVTNDPDQARLFVDRQGYRDVVYKAFSALPNEWRETRVLRPAELSLLDSVRHAPVIFQEYVPADVDLRVTVVGEHVFAAAIGSQQTAYPVDFRMDMARATVSPVDLPDEVADQLRRYLDALGLVYGAIDMRLRPDGEYVFLEVNPAGQWLFIEERTGQPISAAVAQALLDGDTRT